MEVTFNFLEIRAMNTYPEHQVTRLRWFFFSLLLGSSQRYVVSFSINCLVCVQVVIDTDKTTYSLRLQTQDQLDHMVNHINYALSRVFNNSIYA